MRSRALPGNFDRLTAFDATVSLTPQINVNPIISPVYRSARDIGVVPGCSPESQRTSSCEEYVMSPRSSSDAVSEWAPGSLPTSKTHSPISPTHERQNLSGSLYSHIFDNRRQSNPYTQSESFPPQHGTPPYSQEPRRRFRAYSLASPNGTSNAYSGSARRTSYDLHQSMYRAADASSFVQRPSLPPFQGQLSYAAPRRNSYEEPLQPSATSDNQVQQATRSTGFTQPLRVGTSSNPTPDQPQGHNNRSTSQSHETSHEIRSAPPITAPQVPWPLSRTQYSGSMAFPGPYTSQAPFSTFGGSTSEEAIKTEEGTSFGNVRIMGLGLPQQVFSQRPG